MKRKNEYLKIKDLLLVYSITLNSNTDISNLTTKIKEKNEI